MDSQKVLTRIHSLEVWALSPPTYLPASGSGMVRTYVRKGGWGGARAGSGNKPGHWEAQGGRAAAASAKVKFKKELKAAIEEKRQKLDECWSLWSNKVCRSPPPECCARMCIS